MPDDCMFVVKGDETDDLSPPIKREIISIRETDVDIFSIKCEVGFKSLGDFVVDNRRSREDDELEKTTRCISEDHLNASTASAKMSLQGNGNNDVSLVSTCNNFFYAVKKNELKTLYVLDNSKNKVPSSLEGIQQTTNTITSTQDYTSSSSNNKGIVITTLVVVIGIILAAVAISLIICYVRKNKEKSQPTADEPMYNYASDVNDRHNQALSRHNDDTGYSRIDCDYGMTPNVLYASMESEYGMKSNVLYEEFAA